MPPVLMALVSVFASPAEPQSGGSLYQVEVVIFRTGAAAEASGGSEGAPELPRTGGGGDASSGGAAARLVATLPASSYKLDEVVAKLQASGAYRPLVHAAWTQTPAPWGSRSGLPLARVGASADGLAGTVYLERGEYLHLGFAMAYGRATITEMRRVRLNEKNYFDNPYFGALAVVTAAR